MKKLGTVIRIDIQQYCDYVKSLTPEERIQKYWYPDTCIWGKEKAVYQTFDDISYEEVPKEIRESVYDAAFCSRDIDTLSSLSRRVSVFLATSTPIPYVFRNEFYTTINLAEHLYTVLNEFLQVREFTDIESLTGAQIQGLLSKTTLNKDTSLTTKLNNVSINSLRKSASEKHQELVKLKAEHDRQIGAYRQEMYRKMDEFKELLQAKQDELLCQEQEMLDQLFILEDKIFDIRCILKETFNVVNIKQGTRQDKNKPVVIYQKFRYLEDEIVRLSALGAANFTGNHKLIESVIAHTPILLETLCPNDKCVTVCKVTRNNTYYSRNEYGFFDNIEILHGNQLFVLIRDGQHVDGLWIDEDVFIQDNLFLTDATQTSTVITESTKLRDKVVKEALNRKYLMLIIQVCINEHLINLPNNINILQDTPYIIFSNADRLIDANPYDDLETYVSEINEIKNCRVNDMLLVVQNVNGSNYAYTGYRREYYSYRGNGDEDRAHDATINPGLHKLNAIIEVNDWGTPELKVFVSGVKQWSDANARANIRVENDEYINLTWVSSNHIKYWIESKKINGFSCNSYAQLCTWLKQALEYVQNREHQEFELINKYVRYAYIPKNIDTVNKWKYDNKIRKISRNTVKKFIQQNNLS